MGGAACCSTHLCIVQLGLATGFRVILAPMTRNRLVFPSLALTLTRTLVALALGLWIGGMAFFGAVAAPVLFRDARAHRVADMAPIMVGDMLHRFSFVTAACSVILFLGWLADALLSRPTGLRRACWWAQGGLSGVCVLLGLYLGLVLLPAVQRGQASVLPAFLKKESGQALDATEVKVMGEFDRGHKMYQQVAVVNLWLAVSVLVCLMGRSTTVTPPVEPTGTVPDN